MAKFDYEEVRAVAEELITFFGRSLTFVELGDVAGTPSQPWLGAASPRGAPKQSLVLQGVIVEPSSLNSNGNNAVSEDFCKKSSQIAIVYSSAELAAFDEVVDTGGDGSRWKVSALSKLKPGGTILLYFVGLVR